MRTLGLATAILLAFASAGAQAVETTIIFDTVTRVDLNKNRPSITGIPRNSTTPASITFHDSNQEHAYGFSRCVPALLLMLEKPGRYYLHVTADPDAPFIGFVSCLIEPRT